MTEVTICTIVLDPDPNLVTETILFLDPYRPPLQQTNTDLNKIVFRLHNTGDAHSFLEKVDTFRIT
jgi:hypothetical protein